MYEHLLVALDGSPAAERALEHAEALANAFHSRVTLVRVTISPETLVAQTAAGGGPSVGEVGAVVDPTPVLEAEQSSAREYLDGVAARLRAANINVDTDEPEGSAADVIVARAKALRVSLIVMTTHAHSGLGRLVFGSVGDAVVRHAPCPVLLIRTHEEG